MVIKVSDCGRKHLALVLSILGLIAVLLAGFWWNQQASATLLEARVRANEQFRASTEVKLERIAEDIREIKEAVKPPKTTAKQ
jgi:hypothetical protein